jgi:putative CocE/NonD family hydrolase
LILFHPGGVVKKNLLALVVVIIVGRFDQPASGQQPFDVRARYEKSIHYVPTRDGVRLFTIVYTPRDQSEKYPILLMRTPYGIGPYEPDAYPKALGSSAELAREGYIFVYQDVRGKFQSEGQFEVLKPYKPRKTKPTDTDESSDNYDTIEWLIKNVPNNNGRVGQWGVSYPAWQTVMGMIDAHPALKASSPQASPADMFIGDDFHHNGAFRLMYTFHWLANYAREKTTPFNYGTPDGYRFFLELGALTNVDRRYFKGKVAAWNEYMEHGTYDEYWRRQNFLEDLKNVRHAVLNVAGWFDAEDFYGPLAIYHAIEKHNPDNRSLLAVGPWRHGGWVIDDGDELGHVRFGSKTSHYYCREVELPFFNYYLKGKGEMKLPEATVFETGQNEWRRYAAWPPPGTVRRDLYLQARGKLSFAAPTGASAADVFTSDPDKPVPFTAETRNTQGHNWMVEDQRFAAQRPDVLVYESEVLTEDLTLSGPVEVRLFASTSGTDADWVVKLIDVYPDDAPDNTPNPCRVRMGGFQMLVSGEVSRSRFRESFSKPKALVPGKVTEIKFNLPDKFHRFRKGHKIMAQVQSTWFPVIDRNPQKFVDIYRARDADFQKAEHKVHRSAQSPSHLRLRVLKAAGEQ